jgi:light-harvesting complex I chlorophyll a/b binding protein 2
MFWEAWLCSTDPVFPNNKLTGTDVGYPGGLWFDPLGFGSGPGTKKMRAKEIANGRLAMLAVLGAFIQYRFTGVGPADNLFDHLSNPGYINIVSTFKG